ncbi:MAG: metallophosphoesterase [Cytophagales bacterium]|nr:metallophosphoesterase [Cytophagales bacterium]
MHQSLFSGDKIGRLRFGLVTDSHYAERPDRPKRFYKQSLEKMKHFAEHMNKENLEFVLHMGDIKDENTQPTEQSTLQYLKQIEDTFQLYKGKTYHAIGNHDVDSITKKQFLDHITNSDIPKNRSFYSFDCCGFHLIVLDGCFNPDGSTYAPGNFTWDQSAIPPAQLRWLQKDLKRTSLPTLIFCHQLLFYNDGHTLHNASEVRKILEESRKVLAVFQGHIHRELQENINGIHYCSFNGMVDKQGAEGNSYMIVECTAETIQIHGYYNASSRLAAV